MYHDDPGSWEWLSSTSGSAVSRRPDACNPPSGPWTRHAAAIGRTRLVLTGQTLPRPRHRQRDGSCPPCRGVRGASEKRAEALSDAPPVPHPAATGLNRKGWS